jgi:hypothetical protein
LARREIWSGRFANERKLLPKVLHRAALCDMAIDRFTINLPPNVAEALERRAAADKRSVSNYVFLLVERDLQDAGELSGDDTFEEVVRASKELGPKETLRLIRNALRRKERAA